ncbi:type I-E CRISPR-associated protein Cas6/Cse3/CasE [Nonomuraea sp. NPDC059194]|uniref:type I-E CRISPR-associated protein Cas6/Cse3/CasE n=1 Tax=Nonomuraea sp. NPDC059194 TaxID=3346764 RepID=UPI0036C9F886
MNAWLTRILPDVRRRDVNNDLADADRLHKRVMMLVPDEFTTPARAEAGVLFRLEDTKMGAQLLVQSSYKPLIERLPDGYGEIAVKDLSALLIRLRNGVPVHYRIAANPSKRLGKSAGPRAGQIAALRGADAEEWWVRRAATHGLAVTTVTSQSERDARGKQSSIRHAVVRFDGSAIIHDAELVRAAVLEGVGRGKAYGCGLLSLAMAAQ